MVFQESFTISTPGRATCEITEQVQDLIGRSGIQTGLCTVFVHHTSASLIFCENADRTVRQDLEAFFSRLVRDGDPLFRHDAEGPDDMPAHLRTVLTQSSATVPVRRGRADLGTWQGLFLWEHRTHSHRRRVSVTVIGE